MLPLVAVVVLLAGLARTPDAMSIDTNIRNYMSRIDRAIAAEEAGSSRCKCETDTLDCRMAGLHHLNLSEHSCPGTVRHVILKNNSLQYLPRLPASVETLDVSWNALPKLPRAAQLGPNIRKLNVDWNRATTSGDEFHSLHSLEELSVAGNQLPTLSFLPKICRLRKLIASDNALQLLSAPEHELRLPQDEGLMRCRRLHHLDLSGSRVQLLDPRVRTNVSVTEMGMLAQGISHTAYRVELADIHRRMHSRRMLPQMHNLTQWNITINDLANQEFNHTANPHRLRNLNLSEFPEFLPEASFFRFSELKYLDLSNNRISVLSENTFANLTFLETLKIDSNRLDSLPAGIFSGVNNLQRLNLSGNPLPAASLGELAPLQHLKSLYIDHCEIHELPSQAFANQSQLSTLSACCNRMHSVSEDALHGLLQLQTLRLNNNSLDALPDNLFRHVPSLKILDVSYNSLLTLPSVIFTHLRSLSVLDASSNRLNTLPDVDECCPSPRTVILRNNDLRETAGLASWLLRNNASGQLDRFHVDYPDEFVR